MNWILYIKVSIFQYLFNEIENIIFLMKIIYGVCSWGLGHATRSLPVIRRLMDENNEITIISNGRTLELLKKELDEKIEYIDIIIKLQNDKNLLFPMKVIVKDLTIFQLEEIYSVFR